MLVRHVRPVETSLLWVVVWTLASSAYALVWGWTFDHLPIQFSAAANKMGVNRKQFSKEAAQCVVAITSHAFLGPCALWVFFLYPAAPPELGISLFTHGESDPYLVRLHVYVCICAEIFAGNILYQTLFWFLGWEKTVDALLHHLGFLAVGILVFKAGMHEKVTLAAIGMEASSPFLSLHILFRQLEGRCFAMVSDIASAIFALMFILFRIFFFGYVLLEFHYQVWRQRQLFPAFTSWPLTCAILLAYSAGWLLQWFWLRLILAKLLKVKVRKD